ncbi:MAG: 2-amino-4-hydroxy-6-hydroxymethyldihydropteridine diphosphokinase [Desulfobacterales bacterium]|nr:2-amino-4-hydroxy-6-hydroxymethyldihydropteridine diphosphokinase [Desulfobacterales bacterium]MCP4160239.1 2-amino-4-hydroxy-6-hydroxymethyldihydropteridine diphosphokinase [Deltaproteobacteria bacterium]
MTAYISIGSNIGNKEDNCKRSIKALKELDKVKSVKKSFFYKTSPVDYEDQDWFINCAVEVETDFSPNELLKAIHSIEHKMGRKRDLRYGPRIIDLDIIFFDDHIIESEDLIVPHPRMHERFFVLQPLKDLNGNFNHPVLKKSIDQLIENISSSEQEIDRL